MKALGLIAVLVALAGCGGAKGGGTVRDDCRCEDGCVQACEGGTTHYKTVSRRGDGSTHEKSDEPQEPWVPGSPPSAGRQLDGAERDRVLELAKVEAARVFVGDFAAVDGDEHLIVSTDRLEIREPDGDRLTGKNVAIAADTLQLVHLVDDRIDIVATIAGEQSSRFVVLRVIGESVAEVFVHDGPSAAEIDFVRRGEQWAIRVRDTDQGVEQIFEWNPWEGMFRVPRRAPTAPLN